MITKKQGFAGASFFRLTPQTAFLLLLAVCLLTAIGHGDAEAYDAGTLLGGTITTVNAGAGNQTDPHVDGNLVAYTSSLNGTTQIRYFNLATNTDAGIPTTGTSLDFLSDVSGKIVAFSQVDSGQQSIWTFDTTTAGPAVQLAPGPALNRRNGVIGGATVAWQDLGYGTGGMLGSEVVAYDLPTGTVTRLTSDTLVDRTPAVAQDGNVVVWEKCATAIANCDIWQAVKGATGWTVSQVTATPDDERFADTNGTLVVYGGSRAGSATVQDIYWRPVAGGPEGQLAMPVEQRNANISGNMIAFESRDLTDPTPNWDIYLYDLGASTLHRLTDTPGLDEVLNDISVVGGQIRVVWSVLEADHNVYATTFAFPVANAGPDQAVHNGSVVTLDGGASADPDLKYPLGYAWTINSAPAGSAATLADPAVVNPSFTADLPGDYTIKLVVKDGSGLVSAADSVTVSTTNTPPVADAGPDQAVTLTGATVQLDGSGSYDLEGDQFTYQWALVQKPLGSAAALSDPALANPTFIADAHGDYLLTLVVSDPWSTSASDSVTMSFSNSKPVADAGGNQSVVAGSVVELNGSGSTDANGDVLACTWSFVSRPTGSSAVLTASLPAAASFTADMTGAYVVSLVVNDGFIDSDPRNVTIEATGGTHGIIEILTQAISAINHEDPGSFKNSNLPNTLTNKINAAIQMIDQGLYGDALDKLRNDILGKTDGCATAGGPDKNDWITICGAQNQVFPLIIEAIMLLSLL
ncbi:MAG: hypothetical protein A2075_07555 [Geobacteraceae bacterium GWC2_58_44]|nr:MAG: hypothetical protein A2075_07555 [Geobacteraceae bacterium GWC2_58_44]HBG05571.1 hypothetical protein [Geobacter sp.]